MVARPALDELPEMDATTSKLLDAAREEFIAHGIARTTTGDIARRADVSRPTLYRRCGDKDTIVAAVFVRETTQFFAQIRQVLESLPSPEDKMIEAFVNGMREARSHPLVRAIGEFDADTFSRGIFNFNASSYQGMLAMLASLVADDKYSEDAAKRALELALRLTSTLLVSRSPLLPTDTDDEAREFARRYLVPLMHAAL